MIFVAHSLSRLVVKEALIETRKQKYHNHLARSTPHVKLSSLEHHTEVPEPPNGPFF
jgi:hypothetical protein